MMRPAFRARPFTHREVLYKRVLVAADAACLARWIEGIHLIDYRSAPCRLVCELAEELRPACIRDGSRQLVVPQHVLDLQMLDRDDLVLVHQLSRELLQGVPTHVSDAFLDTVACRMRPSKSRLLRMRTRPTFGSFRRFPTKRMPPFWFRVR